jgi:hypothetical protein
MLSLFLSGPLLLKLQFAELSTHNICRSTNPIDVHYHPQAIMFLASIWEESGSNLCWDSDYPDQGVPSYLHADARIVLQIRT